MTGYSILPDMPNYQLLVDKLSGVFGHRLKTVVLFGSRARKEADEASDHDIFLVIGGLSASPMDRLKEVRSAIREIPLRIHTIAKTPEEVASNLTPLLFDVCVDGICLYGKEYFDPYRKKAMKALKQSGLMREKNGEEFYWQFDRMPMREWELTWDGFHELS